ncbi:hypothetical protein JCM30471_31280 [Desulfuromonas carbonis]|uniref:RDD family protein n=1 Tax=Desulfuromonas sp. DDH964 TaxID=1823759 RepID=UPI00078B25DC|nr:RDD family protein [Desulfuromonas sp. DDH964]AMV71292.1 hypothetical protein DBW_0910 [Desulfuromonas sp. DDH964]
MNLTCPHCGFQRELPADRLPRVAVRVTCPRCREQFRFEPPAPMPPELPAPGTAPAEEATPLDAAGAAALPKAGFWIRVVASLVDSTLVTLLQFFFGTALIAAAVALTGGSADQGLGMAIAWSFGPALGVIYYVGFTGYCGQTPGKMALRIKVIRTNGNDIGYGVALVRETVGKFLSTLILGIGYLMVAFDEQKQGLHDRLVKTYVIKL